MSQIKTIITAKDNASSVMGGFMGTVVGLNQALELTNKVMGALTAPFKAVIDEGKAFESQMAAVKSISKTTAAEFAALNEEAKRIGATTSKSAVEAGKAMESLKRAGQDTNQVIKTTAKVVDLATAQNIELGRAADVVAISMNVFKKQSLDAQTAVDLINKTVGASPQEFGNLAGALEASGGTAAAFNIKFEELTQVLGVMADAGYKGEKAGTALNAAMARLAGPTTEVQKALEKYGINVAEVSPATHSLTEIFGRLNKANIEQKDLFKILGQEAAPKFFKVIAEGAPGIQAFADKQKEANTAAESAAERLNTLEGQMQLFGSAMSAIKIEIFEQIKSGLQAIVEVAAKVAGSALEFIKVNNIFGKLKRSIGYILIGFAEFLDIIIQIAKSDTVSGIFESYKTALDGVFEAIGPLVTSFREFITELFSAIEDNEKLQGVIQKVVSAFGKAVTIILKISKLILNVLKPAIRPLLNILAELADVIVDVVLVALDGLEKAVDFLADPIGKTKRLINELKETFTKLADDVKKNVIKKIDDLKQSIDKLIQPVIKVGRTLKTYFIDPILAAYDAAKKFDHILWKGSLGPSLEDLIDPMEAVRDNARALGKSFLEDEVAAKKMEEQVKNTTAAINEASAAAENASTSSSFFDFFTGGMSGGDIASDLGSTALSGIISILTDALNSMTSVVTSLVGALVDMLMSNEDVEAAMDEIKEAIMELVAPVAKSMLPTIKSLGESLKKVITAILPALKEVVTGIGGSLTKLVDDLMPTIMSLTKKMGPYVTRIMTAMKPIMEQIGALLKVMIEEYMTMLPSLISFIEAVAPVIARIIQVIIGILQALTPLMQAIVELLTELMPILELILDIIINVVIPILKAVIAVITFVINIITAVVTLIATLLDMLRALPEWIATSLRNALATALAPLLILMATIVLSFQNLGLLLEELKNGIENFIGGITDLLENLGGALGSAGNTDGGPNILQPPWTWFHDGAESVHSSDLVRMPGMNHDEGLAVLKAGETVTPPGGSVGGRIKLNIKPINPREQSAEIRQILEEYFLTGRPNAATQGL